MTAPSHIVVLTLENENFGDIVGAPAAPYLNSLIAQGMLFTNFRGETHPSQPNYLALFSGSTWGVATNGLLPQFPANDPTLASALAAKGYTFGGYAETGAVPERQPWTHFANSAADAYNFSAFPQTAAGFANLPTVSFVTPTDADNLTPLSDNGGGIAAGDAWVQANISAYAAWAQANNSLLIITFDENNTNPAVTLPNHTTTIVVGAGVPAGVTNDSLANHYSLLNTIESFYGLTPIGVSAGAPALDFYSATTARAASTITKRFSGISDPNNTPPQNALAAGPNYVFTAESSRYMVSDINGNTVIPDSSLFSMFSGLDNTPAGFNPTLDNSLLDARAAYDSSTGRYVVIADNFQPGTGNFGTNIAIAVSVDSNPADGWRLASVDTSNGFTTQSDMPYLSVSNGNIYISTPEYLDAGGGYNTAEFVVGESSVIAAGNAAIAPNASNIASGSNGIMRNVAGANGKTYYLSAYSNHTRTILAFQAYDATTGTFSAPKTLGLDDADVGGGGSDFTAAQLGTTKLLSINDSRIQSLAYASSGGHDYIYGVSEVMPSAGANAEIEWFKLDVTDPANPQVVTGDVISGALIGAGVTVFNPSIAIDQSGDVLINFSASGPNIYPADYYMVLGAGLSTFSAPTLYQASDTFFDSGSPSASTNMRWGTYSTAVADPNNPNGFWISNEYVTKTGVTIPTGLTAWWSTVTAEVNVSPSPKAPAAPTITSPVSGSTDTTTANPVISGTGITGDTVSVNIDGVFVGTAPVSNNVWSYTPTSPLGNASHTITATQAAAGGPSSAPSAADVFTVYVPPAAPTIATPVNGSVDTTTAKPVISGTGITGDTVTVSIDGSVAGTALVSGNAWSFTPTTALSNASHTITATQAAPSGPSSAPSAADTFTVNVISGLTISSASAPLALVASNNPLTITSAGSIVTTASGDAISGGSGTVWQINNAGKISGAVGSSSAAIYLQSAGSALQNTGSISGATAGLWLANGGNVTNGATGLITATGNYGVYIGGAPGVVTNAGTITGAWYAVDLAFSSASNRLVVAPGAVFNGLVSGGNGVLELAAGSSSGAITGLNTGSLKNFATLVVDAGASWTLNGSNTIASVTDNGSLDIAGVLPSATYQIGAVGGGGTLEVASAPGAASPISFLGNSKLIIDSATAFGANVGSPSYTGPLLEGFASGDTIDVHNVSAAGASYSYNSASGLLQIVSGLQTASLDFQTSTLGGGAFSLASDGGTGLYVTLTNAPPPAAPTITSPVSGSTDTTTTEPVISGTGISGDTVVVSIDGAIVGTAPVFNNLWSYTPTTPLGNASHTITATQGAAGGPSSAPSAADTFTVNVPVPPPAAPTIASPVNGSIDTTTSKPVISGTGISGDTVTVSIDGTVAGTALVSGNAWSFTPTTALSNASHTLTATQAAAGGPSSAPSAADTFIVNLGSGLTISSAAGPLALVASYNPLTITSAGSIVTTASGDAISGGSGTAWQINNAGTISGAVGSSSAAIYLQSAGSTVQNTGSISGATAGLWLANGGNVTNGAAGRITATGNFGVYIGGAPGVVTNAGTITAAWLAVDFTVNSSANLLIVDPGAVFNGGVNGNGGVLELAAGTGSIGQIGSSAFSGFGALSDDAGALWTLTGANTIANVTVNGALTVAGSLDVSVGVNSASAGQFDLLSGGSLELAADTAPNSPIDFLGSSALIIDNASLFGTGVGGPGYAGPLLENFSAGDSIDLHGFSALAAALLYNPANGLLQVTNGASQVASLDFQNSTLGTGSFSFASDGSGGTLIKHS